MELAGILREGRSALGHGQPPAKVISWDEMWTYVGARRREVRQERWIWTAVVEEEDGGTWTDTEVGDRSEETFLKLYNRLPEAARHVSNGYVVYDLLPANRHVIGKGLEANRNEGRHSALRDKLNRLHRGTKGYSKSEEALRGSVALICLQQAWI